MNRLVISPSHQLIIDSFRTDHSILPNAVVSPGTNLLVDDHVEIDSTWYLVVLGPDDDQSLVSVFVPDWELLIEHLEFINYVTDRAGPNGEEMPIYPELEMEARASQIVKAPEGTFQDAVRDALARLPKKERKEAEKKLRKVGFFKS